MSLYSKMIDDYISNPPLDSINIVIAIDDFKPGFFACCKLQISVANPGKKLNPFRFDAVSRFARQLKPIQRSFDTDIYYDRQIRS